MPLVAVHEPATGPDWPGAVLARPHFAPGWRFRVFIAKGFHQIVPCISGLLTMLGHRRCADIFRVERIHSSNLTMQIGSEITKTLTELGATSANSIRPKKTDILPGLIESLGTLATDSTASVFNRLEAIEILLRLAIGPRNRPADRIDVAASRNAKMLLSDAAPFLDQTMISKNNRARIRLQAASLASLVGKLASYQVSDYHDQASARS